MKCWLGGAKFLGVVIIIIILSEVSDWDILIHNHFQLTSHVIFNQNVSPGMPLASSVDKNERTETMPFIQALSYRHNDFFGIHT